MSVFTKAISAVANFVGGDVIGAAKDLALRYLPPDMTPAEKADFEFKFADLARQKALEAGTLANTQLESELRDVQSARQAHAMSIMPAVLTVMMTCIVCAIIYVLVFVTIPPDNMNLATPIFGTVFTLWVATVTYWVGTTRSSGEKSNIIAQLQPMSRDLPDAK